jgi:diaminopimelate epimerase
MIYFCLDSRRDAVHYTAAWIQTLLPGFDAIWLAEMYRQRLNDILKREFGFDPKYEYIHSVEFPLPLCDDAVLEIRERGTGETIGCGTGCSTAVVAGVLTGRTDRKVTVEQIGGPLLIEWDEKTNHLFMTGPSHTVFEAEIDASHVLEK